MRFTGLAEVEFKRDPRNGQFKVLDINPRVGAGTHCPDVPVLISLSSLAPGQGDPVPRLRGRAGERWVLLSADLRVAIEEMLGGRLSLWTTCARFAAR